MDRNYQVVDAFTGTAFQGNAAAVVFDAEGLNDREMASVAAEFNLSETTFVLPVTKGNICETLEEVPACLDKKLRIRWFTPTIEASMCGHATIAALHAMVDSGRWQWNPERSLSIGIETISGPLTAWVECLPGQPETRLYWLELLPPKLKVLHIDTAEVCRYLGLERDAAHAGLPVVSTQDLDVLFFVQRFDQVQGARPDFRGLTAWLKAHGMRGLSLATTGTLTPSINVQSRFFGPVVGIDEDAVTGSVHGPLAAYLVEYGLVPERDGVAGMTCTQGKPGGRTGLIHALVERKGGGRPSVRIAGQAVTTMRGNLLL